VAQRRTSKKPGTKGFYYLIAVVVLIGAAAITWAALKRDEPVSAPTQLPASQTSDPQTLVRLARGVKAGSDTAPVRLLVFSDYMCPACAHFATKVEPQLHAEYVNSGKVQVVYHDFPLVQIHKWSFAAARAARCAEEQKKFWEYHDKLFAAQRDWMDSDQMPEAKFRTYATEVGLNESDFTGCLSSERHSELVSANLALGNQVGVPGTPALYMNGKFLPNDWQDYGDLKKRVQEALATNSGSH
jgi:protein-disulfide isomerase